MSCVCAGGSGTSEMSVLSVRSERDQSSFVVAQPNWHAWPNTPPASAETCRAASYLPTYTLASSARASRHVLFSPPLLTSLLIFCSLIFSARRSSPFTFHLACVRRPLDACAFFQRRQVFIVARSDRGVLPAPQIDVWWGRGGVGTRSAR
eukprot:3972109-Pleurochrysis_carterae.AAC.4